MLQYKFSCLFRAFIWNNSLCRKVSKQNEDISTSASSKSCRISTNFKKMYFICKDKLVSDNNTCKEGSIGRCKMYCDKQNLMEQSKNIIKVTRAVGFIKPFEGLIFFVVDNLLILLLSTCTIISLVILRIH